MAIRSFSSTARLNVPVSSMNHHKSPLLTTGTQEYPVRDDASSWLSACRARRSSVVLNTSVLSAEPTASRKIRRQQIFFALTNSPSAASRKAARRPRPWPRELKNCRGPLLVFAAQPGRQRGIAKDRNRLSEQRLPRSLGGRSLCGRIGAQRFGNPFDIAWPRPAFPPPWLRARRWAFPPSARPTPADRWPPEFRARRGDKPTKCTRPAETQPRGQPLEILAARARCPPAADRLSGGRPKSRGICSSSQRDALLLVEPSDVRNDLRDRPAHAQALPTSTAAADGKSRDVDAVGNHDQFATRPGLPRDAKNRARLWLTQTWRSTQRPVQRATVRCQRDRRSATRMPVTMCDTPARCAASVPRQLA